ncbi:MAG: crotonase/enoyl-CoA hydratase family protein [Ardenticatenales bacterium]|nr:crotonase/enoyl-CoA hydratase family protein [Ardenticatenales bacterium]
MEDSIRIWQDGPVYVVQFNRPRKRNAINADTAVLLRDAWLRFEAEDALRVGILAGDDEAFSAGADLTDLDALMHDVLDENGPLGFTRHLVSKPIIAAIAGPCVAGGLEMACWCDMRVADESATFGCLERRFGVPLVNGGTQRLPQIVGLGWALDLILTGRRINVSEALAMGLINRIVPQGKSLDQALALAQQIALFPQVCVRQDRLAVYQGLGQTLQEGLRLEAWRGQITLESGEPQAGARAFQSGRGRGGRFESSEETEPGEK